MPRARAQAGTTLIEVLVVIVIFLVGILAVVQIFPKGFQILLLSRNQSVATALSRDEIERLKSRPDQLPDGIVALYPNGTIDYERSPFQLGVAADEVTAAGMARLDGGDRGEWTRFAGANATRHIIGETRRVPAPRRVGAEGNPNMYGGLFVCQFNPVDTVTGTGFQVYGNDLNLQLNDWNPEDDRTDSDVFLADPTGTPTLRVPSGNRTRVYRIVFSAYVQDGTAYVRRDFPGLSLEVPIGGATAPYPLYSQTLASLLLLPQNNIGGRFDGIVLGTIDPTSVRVQRQFEEIGTATIWNREDIYQYRLLTPELGVLLFHPRAATEFIPRGSGREPLKARVDYDVYDWRVLREEFRFPYGLPAQHRLAVGSLKVGGQQGADGRQQIGIENLEGTNAADPLENTGHARADHFVLMDLDTGGVILEKPNGDAVTSANPIVTLDKTTGLVSVRDTDGDASNGITVQMRLPDGTIVTNLQIDNRALRALYMVRNEYAVQVLKAASVYTATFTNPSYGQYYAGGSSGFGGAPTRIYFPRSDAGRKVTFGEINYRRAGDTVPRQISAQDFVIQGSAGDPLGLPFIDITTIDGAAAQIDYQTNGYAARDVKAASVAVRTIWNPEFFRLAPNAALNVTERIDRWTRGYRKSTNETYLEQGSLQR